MMNPYVNRYRTVQASTADGPQVLMLVFDQLLGQLRLARKAYGEGQPGGELPLLRTMNSVMALIKALDHTVIPELSGNLHRLYLFILDLLQQGFEQARVEPLDQAEDFLTQLRDTWKQAIEQERQAAAGGERATPARAV